MRGSLIVIELPAGEVLQEHRVHERAWILVGAGVRSRSTTPMARPSAAEPGLVAEFNPNESRTVRAIEDARILLLLSPWPGKGHPNNP